MHPLMLTISHQAELLSWAGEVVAHNPDQAGWGVDARAMAALDRDTGRITAVMVINAFFEDSCYLHIASDGRRRWAVPHVITGMFGFIFDENRVNRIIGVTPAANTAALVLLVKLGFTIEGRIRSTSDGKRSNVVSTLFRDECAWLTPGKMPS